MASIDNIIATVLSRADAGPMNETNTRVLLIEPLLDALGWDIHDLNVVTREYKVFDGTFLDYALKLSGKPALFIEAKALGSKLSDPKIVAQTVNYANNEGVIWCVLSDGLRYRVFKANEPVAMDKKLVFEVDLAETADDSRSSRIVRLLNLLSEPSLRGNNLNDYLSDQRVKLALTNILTDPTSEFCDLIRTALPVSQRNLSQAQILASIKRLLPTLPLKGKIGNEQTPTGSNDLQPPAENGDGNPPYTFEAQFSNKSQFVVNLYGQLHKGVMSSDGSIERHFRKWYVSYKIGKRSVLSVDPQKHRMKLFFPLDPAKYKHPLVRDVSKIGHMGTGDMEVRLESPNQLDQILMWVQEAAARIHNL